MSSSATHRNIWLMTAGLVLLAVGLAFKFVHVIVEHVGATVIIGALVLGAVLFLIPSAKDRQWRFVAYFAILLVFLLVYSGSKEYARRYADNISDGVKKGFGLDPKNDKAAASRSKENMSASTSASTSQTNLPPATGQSIEIPIVLHPCAGDTWDGEVVMEGKHAIAAPVQKIATTGERFDGPYFVLKGRSYRICLDSADENLLSRWGPGANQIVKGLAPRANALLAYPDGAAPEPTPDTWQQVGVTNHITALHFQKFLELRHDPTRLPYQADPGELVAVIHDDGRIISVERPFKFDPIHPIHTNESTFTAAADGFLRLDKNTPYYGATGEPTDEQIKEFGNSRWTVHIKELSAN